MLIVVQNENNFSPYFDWKIKSGSQELKLSMGSTEPIHMQPGGIWQHQIWLF